eukprot:Nk52_evm14s2356 gene=Nk52_evmTU14s2356
MMGSKVDFRSKRKHPLRADHELSRYRDTNPTQSWSNSSMSSNQLLNASRMTQPRLSPSQTRLSPSQSRMSPSGSRRLSPGFSGQVNVGVDYMKLNSEYGVFPRRNEQRMRSPVTRQVDYYSQSSIPGSSRASLSPNFSMKNSFSSMNEYTPYTDVDSGEYTTLSSNSTFRESSRIMKSRSNILDESVFNKPSFYSSKTYQRNAFVGGKKKVSSRSSSNGRKFNRRGVVMCDASCQTTADASTQTKLDTSVKKSPEFVAEAKNEKNEEPARYSTPPSTPMCFSSALEKPEDNKGSWGGTSNSCPTGSYMDQIPLTRQLSERDGAPDLNGYEDRLAKPSGFNVKNHMLIESLDEIDDELESIDKNCSMCVPTSEDSFDRVAAPDALMMNRGERYSQNSVSFHGFVRPNASMSLGSDLHNRSISPSRNRSFCFKINPPKTAEKLKVTRPDSASSNHRSILNELNLSRSSEDSSFIASQFGGLHVSDSYYQGNYSFEDPGYSVNSPDPNKSIILSANNNSAFFVPSLR